MYRTCRRYNVVSPESKEALDSGTLAKESIPVFYLDADKKIQNKEHKSKLLSLFTIMISDHKKVSKHHGKKREKKHHKVKSLDKKKDKKVSKEKT